MISLTGDNDTGVDIGGLSIPVPTSPTSMTSDEEEYGTPPEGSILQLQQEYVFVPFSNCKNFVKWDKHVLLSHFLIAKTSLSRMIVSPLNNTSSRDP